jgi:hypothetical protein
VFHGSKVDITGVVRSFPPRRMFFLKDPPQEENGI